MHFSRRSFVESLSLGLLVASQSNTHRVFSAPRRWKGPVMQSSPICVFSKHLQWLDYPTMAETAALVGFDGVDLTVRPGGHVDPEKVEDQLPLAVEAIQKAGLQAPLITTAITDPSDPRTTRILETASSLGITHYRMGYLSFDEGTDPVTHLKAMRAQMMALTELNEKFGMHGAYQNHSGTRIGGPVWDLWHLVEGIDPRWFGCQYDIRHAVVEGGTSWPVGLDLLHPYIQTTAIKDFLWERGAQGWRIKNVPLGQGMVNFEAYFGLVKKYNITGPISVHFEYPLPHEEAPERPKEILQKATILSMKRDVDQLRMWRKAAGI